MYKSFRYPPNFLLKNRKKKQLSAKDYEEEELRFFLKRGQRYGCNHSAQNYFEEFVVIFLNKKYMMVFFIGENI